MGGMHRLWCKCGGQRSAHERVLSFRCGLQRPMQTAGFACMQALLPPTPSLTLSFTCAKTQVSSTKAGSALRMCECGLQRHRQYQADFTGPLGCTVVTRHSVMYKSRWCWEGSFQMWLTFNPSKWKWNRLISINVSGTQPISWRLEKKKKRLTFSKKK